MKLTKTMLEQITTIVKSCIQATEYRLEGKIESEFRRMRILETQRSMEVSTQINIQTVPAHPMEPIEFWRLSPGSCFRLDAGSQPIMKLAYPTQKWEYPMAYNANAYYIRTGSTVHIPDSKKVVPIKATLIIDEARK